MIPSSSKRISWQRLNALPLFRPGGAQIQIKGGYSVLQRGMNAVAPPSITVAFIQRL
jgi:hypothetical protein